MTEDDVYLAIPLQKGQISSRELMLGAFGHRLLLDCRKDQPITINDINTPYAENESMKKEILERGLGG